MDDWALINVADEGMKVCNTAKKLNFSELKTYHILTTYHTIIQE